MANLTKLMLVIVAIYIVFAFTGALEITTPNEMYDLMTNPEGWSGSSMFTLLNGALTAIGAGLVIVGTLLPGKNDLLVFGGLSIVFLSFGAAFAELFTLIAADAEAMFTGGGNIIATLFVSPIIVIFFMTIISFWRSRAD